MKWFQCNPNDGFIFTDDTDPTVSCRQANEQMQKYLSGSYSNLILVRQYHLTVVWEVKEVGDTGVRKKNVKTPTLFVLSAASLPRWRGVS